MKRILLIVTLLMTMVLAACQANPVEQAETKITVTLQITKDGKTASQEVVAEQGDSVMDVLEDYHQVEEDNGMVTAIDGVSQNPSTNTYWMYKINDQMADKGAEELKLAAGDTIEFYLETFE